MLEHPRTPPPNPPIDGSSTGPTHAALAPGLYVVATPIGRLSDLSGHACTILRSVDVVAAEDTRVTRVLLDHLGARPTLIASHAHNEAEQAHAIVARVQAGQCVALTSDAGTPGISDPGARVVAAMHAANLPVWPVPGPSAVTALLSVAGFSEPRFLFEGFLPSRASARRERLSALAHCQEVVVIYESPHRILATAADLAACLEPTRIVVLGRELTKRYEQIHRGPVAQLLEWLHADSDRQRGEFVLGWAAAPWVPQATDSADPWLRALGTSLPPRQLAKIAATVTGLSANHLYERILALREPGSATE